MAAGQLVTTSTSLTQARRKPKSQQLETAKAIILNGAWINRKALDSVCYDINTLFAGRALGMLSFKC